MKGISMLQPNTSLDLSKARALSETKSVKDADTHLQAGWQLISVASYSSSSVGMGEDYTTKPYHLYSFGWFYDEEPIYVGTR